MRINRAIALANLKGAPAGTSVNWPMWRHSSVMKDWQKLMTSLSERPLGSKSEPPLAPPIGSVVREFFKICSKPRNCNSNTSHDEWLINDAATKQDVTFV